eukprot:g15970.t1
MGAAATESVRKLIQRFDQRITELEQPRMLRNVRNYPEDQACPESESWLPFAWNPRIITGGLPCRDSSSASGRRWGAPLPSIPGQPKSAGQKANKPKRNRETEGISLTIFELQVVTSLLLFARHQVDVAIIEVGMGGLEDATNVLLEPAACCITSIALDHEKFLGPTHEDIAKHKAGIFQRGRPAYVAKDGMSESVQRVIAEVAERVGALSICPFDTDLNFHPEHGSEIRQVVGEPPHGRGRGHQTLQVPGFDPVQVPLLGNYQRSNAALALAMLVELRATKLPLRSCAKILDDHQLDNSSSPRTVLDWQMTVECELRHHPGRHGQDQMAGTLGLDPPGWEAGVAGRCSQPTRSRGVGPLRRPNGAAQSSTLGQGAPVLERRQMATLPPGALVEINGLKEALHLNGLVGELAEPTPAEQAENAERRIVDLEDAQGRVAEQQLGFDENSGRLVVDVLSLLPGGPILERILMWPEHLQRRPFQPGDGVTLRALQSDEGLNGRPGIVQGLVAGGDLPCRRGNAVGEASSAGGAGGGRPELASWWRCPNSRHLARGSTGRNGQASCGLWFLVFGCRCGQRLNI